MIEPISSFDEYRRIYKESVDRPEDFWEGVAKHFQWRKPWSRVLDWNFDEPRVKWFDGAELNITENCLDRHLADRGDDTAIIWEPNDPAQPGKTYTYRQLHAEVCRMANALQSAGIAPGDRVILYMPMVPELAIACLAIARVGAIHSVVFAGFSHTALSDRLIDADPKLIITADGLYRGPKEVGLKQVVDQALVKSGKRCAVWVHRRTGTDVSMQSGRDSWLSDVLQHEPDSHEAVSVGAEDPLFILYTSGSTGKPKGVVHTCGGYMVYTAYSFAQVFQYRRGDVFWCTADLGWITGHSYILYGPLLNGATVVMFEGVPTWPDYSRCWQVCEKYGVTHFYTAPTAIRSLMAAGNEWVDRFELKSLKALGSVGEPINAEAWHWFHRHVGKGRCPIADTWWQTETGGIAISGLCGVSPEKPTFAAHPLPGIQPVLLNQEGRLLEANNVEGLLAIKFPWPSILRTTWGNHERCKQTYFSHFPGYYFTGDGARRDENGWYRISGRVDDVINVSGHRFGTAEIENALDESPMVTESAVVGFPHELKGQGIYAFIIPEPGHSADEENVRKSALEAVEAGIGKIARPDKLLVVSGLPKTRSGKIMRRILRKIAEGETDNLGDTSTLLDPEVVGEITRAAKALNESHLKDR